MLIYSEELPVTTGYYWYWEGAKEEAHMVEVRKDRIGGNLYAENVELSFKVTDSEPGDLWCGPIEVPKKKDEVDA